MATNGALSRIEGWEGRLAGFVAQARTRAFLYGEFDCCLMAASAVREITDVDPAAALRGRYKTARGAIRALKRFAGGGLTETAEKIAAEIGASEVTLPFARRGDIVLFTDRALARPEFGAFLGLCLGREAAVMTLEGLQLWPLARAARAWRVGD